jgi:hypothetical protein
MSKQAEGELDGAQTFCAVSTHAMVSPGKPLGIEADPENVTVLPVNPPPDPS